MFFISHANLYSNFTLTSAILSVTKSETFEFLLRASTFLKLIHFPSEDLLQHTYTYKFLQHFKFIWSVCSCSLAGWLLVVTILKVVYGRVTFVCIQTRCVFRTLLGCNKDTRQSYILHWPALECLQAPWPAFLVLLIPSPFINPFVPNAMFSQCNGKVSDVRRE